MTEKRLRTTIKTITWRFLATVTTMGLVYAFTGELKLAAEIGVLEVIIKLIIYYLHERTWNHIVWGKTIADRVNDTISGNA